jgi:hypothetical protein
MVVINDELITAATPFLLALLALVLQYLRSKDTNKHGDAFIAILKGTSATMKKVAEILPAVAPYSEDYAVLIDEAEKIWNSGGFTAEDIQALTMRAQIIKSQYNDALAKYRALKDVISGKTV